MEERGIAAGWVESLNQEDDCWGERGELILPLSSDSQPTDRAWRIY
jgi:hypothetical protein